MAKLHELRKLIRTAIMQEMNSTASGGAIGTAPNIIQTPNAFTGGKSHGEAKRRHIGTLLGMRLVKQRKGKISESRRKLFEDVINKADFDIKMSDQAKELMDFVMGSEKYKEDIKDIKELFDRMQADGTFAKEDAFKVYQDFIQRAARDFVKQTGVNMKADEYFLRKDILDVVYYELAKIEDPMSGQPTDNIDGGAEAGAAPPPEGGGDMGGGEGGSTGGGGGVGASMSGGFPSTGEEAPDGGEPELGPEGQPLPPAEPGAEGAPTGAEGEEVPPEGEEEAPPKPEEIAELSSMIREIYEDIAPQQSKLEELEALRATTKDLATKYAKTGDRNLAIELVKMMNYLDKLSDKFALQPAAPKMIKKRIK